jgi:hypothetical protein
MLPTNSDFDETQIDPEMIEVCKTIWSSDWATTTETCWGHIDYDGTQDYGSRQVEPGCDPYVCIGIDSLDSVAKLQEILRYFPLFSQEWRIMPEKWRGITYEVIIRPIDRCNTVYEAREVVRDYLVLAQTIVGNNGRV